MDDFDLGSHHLSVEDLPFDPYPHFDRLNNSRLETRNRITARVDQARELISTKMKELGEFPFGA
jgi:hypothetical protein